MFEGLLGLIAGLFLGKVLGPTLDSITHLFVASAPGPIRPTNVSFQRGGQGGPVGPPPIQPSTISPPVPKGGLVLTSTAAPFPTVMPNGLPPFPSGWTPAKPLSSSIIQRAQLLLTTMNVGERKTEQADDGRWITYLKSRDSSSGRVGVTAWQPKTAVSTSSARV